MSARRIGILGGTFDPIHCGHLDLGQAAEERLELTDIFVVTSNIPPHRPQPLASGYHRFAMVALAIAGRPRWRASDLELASGAMSFTVDTLRHFHDEGFSPTELFFVVGTDAFADVESWKDYPAILDRAHFVVVSRPGFPVSALPARLPTLRPRMTPTGTGPAPGSGPLIFLLEAGTHDVSASAIRRRCATGESIAGLVPVSVQQHIERNRLYLSSAAGLSREVAHDARSRPAAGRLHGQD